MTVNDMWTRLNERTKTNLNFHTGRRIGQGISSKI